MTHEIGTIRPWFPYHGMMGLADDLDHARTGDILIVDDVVANVRVLTTLLGARGYKVRGTTSGAMALRAARAAPPDLVLLDVNMPEKSGYEVCRELKADAQLRDIPVLFISAADEPLDRSRAYQAGGVDYLGKPFQEDEVLARVSTQLLIRALSRRLAEKSAPADARAMETQDQVRRLTLLSELSHRITLAQSETEFFQLAAQYATRLFPKVARSSVALLTPTGDELEVFALEGNVGAVPVGARLPVASTMLGEVVNERRVLLKAGAECSPDSPLLDVKFLAGLGMRSTLDAPLITGGQVIGTLNTASPDASAYQAWDEYLLLQVAALLSANIERWRLITRMQAALHEARQHKEAAEAASRSKSTFLSHMSHELRTPLSAILGFAQILLRSEEADPAKREKLQVIMRSGEHLLQLINNVLEMSKIEAGQMRLSPRSFDLSGLLDEVRDLFAVRAEQKGLRLIVERSPDLPRYVCADDGKLRQVLINLIGNAIKFTARGGVSLRAGKRWADEPPLVDFEVEDSGAGIAEEELESIFAAFVQSQRAGVVEGTGLGLAISRQFVRLLGGEIRAESVLGRGSIFRFSIPTALSDGSEVERQRHRPKVLNLESGQPTWRILVVEDRADNRLMMVSLLKPLGFDVRGAENGMDAVATFTSWNPDLIWMDMRMPILDGYAATRRIKAEARASGRAVIIIALTASAFEEERSQILAAGCDDFMRKPFLEHEIFDKLSAYLGARFIYEQERPQHTAQQPAELRREDLLALPEATRESLRAAAMAADDQPIRALLAELPATQASIKSALLRLVDELRFEALLDLTA